jgi:hypothetical protein
MFVGRVTPMAIRERNRQIWSIALSRLNQSPGDRLYVQTIRRKVIAFRLGSVAIGYIGPAEGANKEPSRGGCTATV